jgi:hypothetical protein
VLAKEVGVRIEVLHFQLRGLAVAATGFERRPYQLAKIGVGAPMISLQR